jgi:hypothetical protein
MQFSWVPSKPCRKHNERELTARDRDLAGNPPCNQLVCAGTASRSHQRYSFLEPCSPHSLGSAITGIRQLGSGLVDRIDRVLPSLVQASAESGRGPVHQPLTPRGRRAASSRCGAKEAGRAWRGPLLNQ